MTNMESIFGEGINHRISLELAAEFTENYRSIRGNIILGEFFNRESLQELLRQQDCTGMRIYYGLASRLEPDSRVLVLVGTDRHGNDLVRGIILDQGLVCPPYCSNRNPLNSNIRI